MKEKLKHWELPEFSKFKDLNDFFNESLDIDIKSVKDLLSNITQDIQNKNKSKGKGSTTNQSKLNPIHNFINELNLLLQKQHTKRIEQDLTLERIQHLIQSNSQLISNIQYILLNKNNSDKEFRKLNKSRTDAIQAKDYEKTALYRDIIVTFELINYFQSISNEFESSSFFVFKERTIYFIVKNTNPFNSELRKILETNVKL